MQATNPEDKNALFNALLKIPSVTDVHLQRQGDARNVMLTATLSQRDQTDKTKRRWVQNVLVSNAFSDDGDHALAHFSLNELHAEVAWTSHSPTSALKAVGRSFVAADKKKKKHLVEIISQSALVQSIEVTESHGDFYTDTTFGGFSWCEADGKQIFAYVAEEKVAEEDKFKLHQDFGEGYTKKRRPIIVLLSNFLGGEDPKTNISIVQVDGLALAQPVVDARTNSVYFIGYSASPLPYGIKFCHNRHSAVYKYCMSSKNVTQISRSDGSARSLRMPLNGKYLCYLFNRIGGPHAACSRLMSLDVISGEERVLVDLVRQPLDNDFPGLYVDQFPRSCFIEKDGKEFIICSSIWRSNSVMLSIDLRLGSVRLVNPKPFELASWDVLSVQNDMLITCSSNPGHLPRVTLLQYHEDDELLRTIDLELCNAPSNVNKALAEIYFDIQPLTRPGSVGGTIETILVRNLSHFCSNDAQNATSPLIVIPHGGPHGALTTSFSIAAASLVIDRKCSVLLVNYTGSLGFGQDCIDGILGRIGDVDVEDTHFAAQSILSRDTTSAYGHPHFNKVGLLGGSHGGFIAAHLLGKYPEFYACGVLRNPVINVGAMVANTDIPDWCYGEAGLPYDLNQPGLLSPDDYRAMFEASPAASAHNIQSPVLLLLGETDRRVPPSEGLRWAQYLRGQGKPIDVLVFPENGHPLDGVEAERVGYKVYADFLAKHLE